MKKDDKFIYKTEISIKRMVRVKSNQVHQCGGVGSRAAQVCLVCVPFVKKFQSSGERNFLDCSRFIKTNIFLGQVLKLGRVISNAL